MPRLRRFPVSGRAVCRQGAQGVEVHGDLGECRRRDAQRKYQQEEQKAHLPGNLQLVQAKGNRHFREKCDAGD
jgi:hypothetical protein